MNISNYLRNKTLNHFFRGEASTSPSTFYVALFTNNPTASSTGTEVSGGSYERQIVTFTAPATVDGKQQITNSTDIEFPLATAGWGTITHAEIKDQITTGNAYYFGALTTPKIIETGDVIRISAGELKLNIA